MLIKNNEYLDEVKDRTHILVPLDYKDPTNFIKCYSSNLKHLTENKSIPTKVKNDFILIANKCCDLIEWDKNVILVTQTALGERLDVDRVTVNRKIESLKKFNLIKYYQEKTSRVYGIIINPQFFGKFSDAVFRKQIEKIFSKNFESNEELNNYILETFRHIQIIKDGMAQDKKIKRQNQSLQQYAKRYEKYLDILEGNLINSPDVKLVKNTINLLQQKEAQLNSSLKEFLSINNINPESIGIKIKNDN
jgi:DNA-binding transcriptional regulator GbsR (MarR family)